MLGSSSAHQGSLPKFKEVKEIVELDLLRTLEY